MGLRRVTTNDPDREKNAENLASIASSVSKPHWTMVPMFWMTLLILILTGALTWLALYPVRPAPKTEQSTIEKTLEPKYDFQEPQLKLPANSQSDKTQSE